MCASLALLPSYYGGAAAAAELMISCGCCCDGGPLVVSTQAGRKDKFDEGPDKATEILIARVEKFIAEPPGADWDGVDKVKSKSG